MAVIAVSKTVSAGIALEVVDAIGAKFGYSATLPNPDYHPNQWLNPPTNDDPDPLYDPNVTITNPETDQAFAQRIMDERFVEFGKNIINWYRDQQAIIPISKVNNGDFT
jgi:hypothetical protein